MFVTMLHTHSNIVLILLKAKQRIMGGISFNLKFAEIAILVKTSVITIECFTNNRPSMPTKVFVRLSTKERSLSTICNFAWWKYN